jgi:hypothetical protein
MYLKILILKNNIKNFEIFVILFIDLFRIIQIKVFISISIDVSNCHFSFKLNKVNGVKVIRVGNIETSFVVTTGSSREDYIFNTLVFIMVYICKVMRVTLSNKCIEWDKIISLSHSLKTWANTSFWDCKNKVWARL